VTPLELDELEPGRAPDERLPLTVGLGTGSAEALHASRVNEQVGRVLGAEPCVSAVAGEGG
jgi:hypothetical protein